MHFDKNNIIELLNRVSTFALDNLTQISNLNIDLKNNEIEGYYIGLINRQYTFTNDLAILFTNKQSDYLASQLILFRCIADDYIHLTFVINQSNVEEMIINLNADAISKNFNKIKELADLNETKLGGTYPFYPTYEIINELKEKLLNLPNRQHYFSDKPNFKFKSFKTTGNIIRDLKDEEYAHKIRRAYFIWRKLSDFVHYSNFSFNLERNLKPKTDTTYTEFSEIIFYSYQIILSSFKHFENKFSLNLIDNKNLEDYYKDAEH